MSKLKNQVKNIFSNTFLYYIVVRSYMCSFFLDDIFQVITTSDLRKFG